MKYPIEVLSRQDVQQLLNACGKGVAGTRNRCLLAVLYRGGLRIAEALALRECDVDLENCSIRILRGKGNKSRTVGVDAFCCEYLTRWFRTRKRLGIDGPIFCTFTGANKGREISQQYVRGLLVRLKRRSGVRKRVHAHGFRHTHAAELAQESTPLTIIQRQLGHSNSLITTRYCDHLNPTQVIEAIKSRPSPW